MQENQNETREEEKTALDLLVQESNEIIARFKGVWPFDLFPDEVIIDKHAITIVRHIFFGISRKIICHFDDLVNSEVNVGPFFGSLKIYSKYFTDGEEDIKWFSRSDAATIHAILQGLLTVRKEGISLKDLSPEDIISKLYDLGTKNGF